MKRNDSLNGSRVAVIGGAGFLGSHLVDYLCNVKGCKVLVIDNLVAGRKEFINPKAEFRHHDITTSEQYLLNIFIHKKIEWVLNYAAYPYIPDSFERPLHVFNVNAMGALKVINAAQEAGVRGILQVSSAEIYGEVMPKWVAEDGSVAYSLPHQCDDDVSKIKIDESMPVIPHSTYGSAKAAIDALVQVRWREAKTPVIALRQFNCVGERETHPYVVPEIISQLYRGNNWTEYPDGKVYHVRLGNNSTRDFLYAGDQAIMATELLEKGEFGQVYNLGSESSVQVYYLPQMISNIIGCGRVTIQEDESRKRPWEIWHLCSSNEKIYSVIDSRPTVSLEEALQRTVAYYEANGRKWCWES